MFSVSLPRRDIFLCLPSVISAAAAWADAGGRGLQLPIPSEKPRMGDWTEFSYTEKVFDNLRQFAHRCVPLIRRVFMGGDAIAKVISENPPVSENIYDEWTGEWEGDFLGFDPSGSKEYDIHVRHTWEQPKTYATARGHYIVQAVHMVHRNRTGAIIFEQAFNIVYKGQAFGVVFTPREGSVPHVGYSISPGHLVWVRERIVFSERIYSLIGNRRLYHIRGFQVEQENTEDISRLRWMEGWYFGLTCT